MQTRAQLRLYTLPHTRHWPCVKLNIARRELHAASKCSYPQTVMGLLPFFCFRSVWFLDIYFRIRIRMVLGRLSSYPYPYGPGRLFPYPYGS